MPLAKFNGQNTIYFFLEILMVFDKIKVHFCVFLRITVSNMVLIGIILKAFKEKMFNSR